MPSNAELYRRGIATLVMYSDEYAGVGVRDLGRILEYVPLGACLRSVRRVP